MTRPAGGIKKNISTGVVANDVREMADLLPQQRLLLEVLIMSGDIAVADDLEGTILHRTLAECESAGWLRTTPAGAGYNKVSVTLVGRSLMKTQRALGRDR